MGTLTDKLRSIRLRLRVQGFLDRVFLFLFWGFLLNLTVVIIDRMVFIGILVPYMPWVVVLLSITLAFLHGLFKSPTLFQAAVKADERLGIKERLSSAYLLRERETSAAQALQDDAETFSRIADPAKVVVFNLPRVSVYAFLVLFIFVMCNSFLPYFDVAGRKARIEAREEERRTSREVSRRIEALSKRIKQEIDKTAEKDRDPDLQEIAKDLDQLARDLNLDKIDRKDAAVKLSQLADKVTERQNLLKSEIENLEKLSRDRDLKFTRDLSKALATADTKKAQEEIQKIAQALKDGSMSSKDIEKLKSELGRLSEMAKKLNPKLAQKLAMAMKNLEAGDLLKAASELDLAEEDLATLAEAMEQFDMLGKVSMDLDARKRALLADTSVLGCEGEGNRDYIGPGMHGQGIGRGGEAPFDDTQNVVFEDSKIAGEKDKGKIISEVFFKGQPLDGVATEEYKQIYVRSKQEAEDSLSREVIPAGYRKSVIDYFDSINPDELNRPK